MCVLVFGYGLWPSVLVVYCCVTNYSIFGSLKQQTLAEHWGEEVEQRQQPPNCLSWQACVPWWLLAKGFSSSPCEPLHGLPECLYRMIAGFRTLVQERKAKIEGCLSIFLKVTKHQQDPILLVLVWYRWTLYKGVTAKRCRIIEDHLGGWLPHFS